MAAMKNNEYYKLRKTDGRGKKFETPDDLINAANEYFAWCMDNPLLEDTVFNTKEGLKHDVIEKVRVFTYLGLCAFVGITTTGLDEYMKYKEKDYSTTLTRIKDIIYTQKFENAAVGLLNPHFMGKALGLIDKVDNTSSDGTMTPAKNINLEYNGKDIDLGID